jgi:hypothetical protein
MIVVNENDCSINNGRLELYYQVLNCHFTFIDNQSNT